VIQKSGSWFSYNSNKLGQGRDAVKQLIEDNPELMDELEKKIKDKITGAEEAKIAEKESAKEAKIAEKESAKVVEKVK
jgi:recombination protein RecA